MIPELTIYDDSSIFSEGLSMILDENMQYISLIENEFVLESFNLKDILARIDYKKIITFVFKKFFEIITNLWNSFRAAYNRFTNKASLLKKYKKKLENLDQKVEYTEGTIIIYQHLDDNLASNLFKLTIDKLVSEFTSNVLKISTCKDTASLQTTIISIKNSLTPIEEYLDIERGVVLGTSGTITATDFGNEAEKYFKSDRGYISNTLTPDQIRNMTNEYFDSKTKENNIKREKDNLTIYGKSCEKKLSEMNTVIGDKNVNGTVATDFAEIYRSYCDKVQGICTIYLQYFSIKLDMFKNYKIQETNILSNIIINGIKGGIM